VSASLVAGDWGSTRLRLWLLERGEVVERRAGPGITGLEDPAAALSTALGDWQPTTVLLCGMAGAREGLAPASYVACPADVASWREAAASCPIASMRIVIAPGCSSRDARGRPDVMRGEETQIFGAMALDPALARGRHALLLPGTHSKWALVEDGRIAHFRTWMTGELYALLQGSSLNFAGPRDAGEEREGFRAGLARAREGADALGCLFEARAAQVHDGQSPSWAAGLVSGLLIGSEVAAMTPPAPAGPLRVIGDPDLAARYGEALQCHGLACETIDGEACAIAGLELLDDH
jgi:2-dehydro-3-deoxygalactonokinase